MDKFCPKVFSRRPGKRPVGESSASAGGDSQQSQVPHSLPTDAPPGYDPAFFRPPGPYQGDPSQADDSETQPPEFPLDSCDDPPSQQELMLYHPHSPYYIGEPGARLEGRMIIYPEADKGFCPSDESTKVLTACMRAHWNQPWRTWSDVPQQVKKQILVDFEGKCIWHQGLDYNIRSIFPKKCAALFKQTLYNARHRGIRPGFLQGPQWAELDEYWHTPEFEAKSEKGKAARASDKGGSLHTGGSISAATQKMRLEKKEKSTIPVLELHKIRHTKGGKKGGGEWVEPRAKEAWEKATKAVEDWTSTQASDAGSSTPAPLTFEKEKQIWVDTVGGVKKGYAYGLGSLYAPDKHNSRFLGSSATSSPASSVDPAEMAQMREQIAQLSRENQETHDMIRKLLAKKEKKKSRRKHKSKHRRSSSSSSSSESGSSSASPEPQ